MDSILKYQQQLLEQALARIYEVPLSAATQQAFTKTPRHLFVKRYREFGSGEWHDVSDDNLQEHLAMLYIDRPLIIFGDDDDNIPSTISQPSMVLRMLDLLQIQPGHKIFELGTGSGWNAALMGQCVGPTGQVYSLEVIPTVAETAARVLERIGRTNVTVIIGDGGEGYAPGTPYDRAVFTAGAYDIPHHFYEQLREGGLLLAVIKTEGGDSLFLLEKRKDHFESLESLPADFVPLTGVHQAKDLGPKAIETLPEWADLQYRVVSKVPFWWGGKGKSEFLYLTIGIRSFLSITEPCFRAFKKEKAMPAFREEHYFGLWDAEQNSLVLAKDDSLIAYGNNAAKNRLLQSIKYWVDLGMPSAASFILSVYPASASVEPRDKQWIIRRSESQLVWSLPEGRW
jgi:protein-L-isoaspartate(D-aspartate) O-methyltransferase